MFGIRLVVLEVTAVTMGWDVGWFGSEIARTERVGRSLNDIISDSRGGVGIRVSGGRPVRLEDNAVSYREIRQLQEKGLH